MWALLYGIIGSISGVCVGTGLGVLCVTQSQLYFRMFAFLGCDVVVLKIHVCV